MEGSKKDYLKNLTLDQIAITRKKLPATQYDWSNHLCYNLHKTKYSVLVSPWVHSS